MKKTELNIALTFSGGGYRASSFSLGVLTYLDSVKIGDKSLLEHVVVLSTISGGTITGLKYAQGIKRGESMKEIYRSLYCFMNDIDLFYHCLGGLKNDSSKKNKKNKSLITAIANVYDEHLFKGEKFGALINSQNPVHLKYMSFNATDFSTAVQFRFQAAKKKVRSEKKEENIGSFGNFHFRIPESIGKEVRLADILATSSCFPGGFEPINFPDDFILPENEIFTTFFEDEKYPVGLMDGGIVDNQGIEPVLLAEGRMRRMAETKNNCLDLTIISDVSSPVVKPYRSKPIVENSVARHFTLKRLDMLNNILLIVSLVGLILSIICGSFVFTVIATMLLTISAGIKALSLYVGKQMNKLKDSIIGNSVRSFTGIKLNLLRSMLINRLNSLSQLSMSIFMKHIRRLNYNSIYSDEDHINRVIMNGIYELIGDDEKKKKNLPIKKFPENLRPNSAIEQVACKAYGMGTTLWFEKSEIDDNIPNSIIACGQFNTCHNLLMYIDSIKKNPKNTNENHAIILGCEDRLREHWEKFKTDPMWLVNEYTS